MTELDVASFAWHRCPDCDVMWRGADRECWACGRDIPPVYQSGPILTSQSGFGRAMSAGDWQAVRYEIGADPD